MADSLRDQLLKAGFKDKNTARNKKSGVHKRNACASQKPSSSAKSKSRTQSTPADTEAEIAAAKAAKKKIKEEIKSLIESNRVKDYAGTVAFSYQLGTRVKQLFVNEECQKRLAGGELIITRLNGNTHLIPPATGEQIKVLNPDWALVGLSQPDPDSEVDSDYADYQVPDDLNW